jgi:hypothetical protein
MSRANDAAFPIADRDIRNPDGLTIREHFAAMAMQGLLASRERYADHWRIEWDSIASCAVKQAGALIAELAKDQP